MATQPKPEYFDTGDDPTIEQLKQQEKLQAAFSGIIMRLAKLADQRVSDRSLIEQRWFLDLRQYHGRFDETTEAALRATPEKSRAIINMTRPKTKAWAARLSDLLFPADDKNWGISPTPVPELTEKAKAAAQAAEAKHQQAAQMVDINNRDQAAGTVTATPGGEHPLAAAERIGQEALDLDQAAADAQAEMDVAKACSENMSREMDDQLTQCQYPRHSRRVIDDLCKLGSGVMKGPLNGKAAQRWKKVAQVMADGTAGAEVFQLAPVTDGNAPIFLRVDPWSFFPDSNATDMESSESELERHLPNKTQLRRMAKLLDFDPDAVEDLCKNGPGYGTTNDLNYLAQLRSINNEGNPITDRYVVWEFHGPLECDEIETILTVMQGPEAAAKWAADYPELDEVRVILFFCDGRLLKIDADWLLDTNETLYSVVSFEKSESSVLGGYGVPAMMRDPARALAAAWRMMLDNSGLSVGPQIVIDKARISPENGDWRLEPRKVWLKSGDDLTTDAKPFEIFAIPANTQQLAQLIELALKFIDETTSLPLIAQGEQGAHITQTAGGMSMLMNSANVIFRNVVKNFDDDMTTPNIRRLYDWNMQFNPKEEIKGDMQVEARGTSALLVRELQSQNLMVLTERWSKDPVLGPAMKVYDAMRMTVQSFSINPDDVMTTRDDYEAKVQEMAQSQQQQDPRIAAAQITATSNEKIAASRAQSAVQVAETAGQSIENAAQIKAGVTEQTLEHDMGIQRLKISSTERMKAVDIAVEDNRAAEARAEGKPAESATGKGIG